MARNKSSNDSSRKSAPPRAATRASEAPKAKRSKPPAAGAPDKGANGVNPKALVPWPSDEAIAARAYEIYAESGYQDGHAEDHWFQAERELRHMN